jgi:lipid-A-disaccharide synthase
MHPLTMAIAKRVVRTPHFALPNVVLERAGMPAPFRERLQDEVTPSSLAAALDATLNDERTGRACDELRALLAVETSTTFGERVAALL